MRSSCRRSIAVVIAVLLPACVEAATLRVSERATHLRLFDERLALRLVAQNETSVTLEVRATAELADPNDRVVSRGEAHATLVPGLQPIDIALTPGVAVLDSRERDEILHYRLRYRLEVERPARPAVRGVAGIVALSRITPDVFDLRLAASRDASPGRRWLAIVQAARARAGRPSPPTSRPSASASKAMECCWVTSVFRRESRSIAHPSSARSAIRAGACRRTTSCPTA